MTPGDFGSLQEGREDLNTEDYISWRLPAEEDPDDFAFPLTLKTPSRGPSPTAGRSPVLGTVATMNGNGTIGGAREG